MLQRIKSLFLTLIALLLTAACLSAAEQGDTIEFTVEMPSVDAAEDGDEIVLEVGRGITIQGSAELSDLHHLWVFARRETFEPLWWPQGEGRVVDGTWRVYANFGNEADIGYTFDIAVAVFDEDAHDELMRYTKDAMLSNDYRPIAMPRAAGPPKIIHVRKTSH